MCVCGLCNTWKTSVSSCVYIGWNVTLCLRCDTGQTTLQLKLVHACHLLIICNNIHSLLLFENFMWPVLLDILPNEILSTQYWPEKERAAYNLSHLDWKAILYNKCMETSMGQVFAGYHRHRRAETTMFSYVEGEKFPFVEGRSQRVKNITRNPQNQLN